MGDEYVSKCINRHKKSLLLKYIIKVVYTSAVISLWAIIDKKPKKPNYCIDEWHTSMLYDILWNESTYPTLCLLIDMWHRNDHCIKVFSKYISDSNLKVALPLTQDYLNYICRGNDTDENKFIGVLNESRAVPLEVVQII